MLVTALLAEKVVQHAFITWGFTTDRFDLRADAPFDHRWFAVSGGVVAILFAVALAGKLRRARWHAPLYAGLAAFDIAGEFVYQGGPRIVITVSLLVATVLFVAGVREIRRPATQALPAEDP